jgi:ATP-binding cassette, subfamily B, bacterial CvaB/MchF/RaxB
MGIHPLNLEFWHRRRPPIILQTEAAECGLACLAMVAGYFGHRIDMSNMRRRFSISLKGATLASLLTIAHSLQLKTRPLKVDLEHFGSLKLPCILHWDMNHFVVLTVIRRNSISILDPTIGECRLPWTEVSKHFTGVVLELSPNERFKKKDDRLRFTLLSLIGQVFGLRRGLFQLLLLGVALQIFMLVGPFYMQWVVDEALVAADRDLITVLGTGFLLLIVVQTLVGAVRSWITTALSTNLNFQWLGNAFVHLLRLPVLYFEKRHLGDIASRFGSIQTIQRSLTAQFVEGVVDGLLVIATVVVMAQYSLQLTAVACFAVVLYGLLRWSIFASLKEATAEQIAHAAKQHTYFLETVRGVQSVRLFNRAEERRIGWTNALADQFNSELRISRLGISYQSANTLLFGSERVIVIWMAALAVLDTRFSVGMLFAFISYKDQFSQRMTSLIDKLFEFRMLHIHGERVADILLTEPEEELPNFEFDVERIVPDIVIQALAFRYAAEEPYVLADLDLTIPSGQCIAITGVSGCGKTTLVKLLLGLMDPTDGSILVGGTKLKQLGLYNFRQLVGTVMQDDQLFAGSIADNISFFDSVPDQEWVVACARLAFISDEIAAMPMGYNTLVGDIGTGLSGGQRQRLLLARALYKKPKILVLDEATSHLDTGNEELVNEAIGRLQLTRILVAHRPQTIAMAQRVVTLHLGKIVRDVTLLELGCTNTNSIA